MAEEQKDLVAIKIAFAGGTANVALSGEAAFPAGSHYRTFAAAGYSDGATVNVLMVEAGDASKFELHRQAVYNTAAGGSIARSTGTLIAGSNGASLVSFAAADLIVVDVFTAAGRMAGLARIAALEAATDAPVTNADLADMAAYSVKLRNSGSSGAPGDVKISGLTADTDRAPVGDFLLMEESGGALRKLDVSEARGAVLFVLGQTDFTYSRATHGSNFIVSARPTSANVVYTFPATEGAPGDYGIVNNYSGFDMTLRFENPSDLGNYNITTVLAYESVHVYKWEASSPGWWWYTFLGYRGHVLKLDYQQTIIPGAKKTFGASGTNAGLRLAGVTADPSTLVAGDIWYRSDLGVLSYRGASAALRVVTAELAQTISGQKTLASPIITGTMKFAGAKGTATTHGTGFSLAAADSGGLKVCTAAITVTVPSAATLAPNSGDFFSATIYASSGAVTLDGPGATNLALVSGDIAFVFARNGGAIVAGKAPVTVLS